MLSPPTLPERALHALTRGSARAVFAASPRQASRETARHAAEARPTPTVVSLELAAHAEPAEPLVEGLRQAALHVFPDWYAGVEVRFDRARFPHAELELTLEEARATTPDVSGPWFREAWSQARRGLPPRVAPVARAEEARQLALAIDPHALLLLVTVRDQGVREPRVHDRGVRKAPARERALQGEGARDDPAPSRLAVARTAAWLAKETRAAVVLFVPMTWHDDPALDSLEDRVWAAEDALPPVEPLDVEALNAAPVTSGGARSAPAAISVLVEPPIGRPHGGSPAEKLLCAQLLADPALGTLFQFNQQLELDAFTTPRVDVLWREGRLVLEVDGPEHRQASRYRADRHRDYELLVAGYAVLRVTNEEVLGDVERVLHKIRRCVAQRPEEAPR